MSTERINQITIELVGLCAEIQSTSARAALLVKELDGLGVSLAPEVRAMFLNFSKQLKGSN